MKLLFDQNLSPKLVSYLGDIFPGSDHVDSLGLGSALDREIRDFALKNQFVIVTKDVDFSELGLLLGFPPKIIWIRRGNCTTRTIENILRDNHSAIESMADDPNLNVLTLI